MFSGDSRTFDPAEITEVGLLEWNTNNTMAYWGGGKSLCVKLFEEPRAGEKSR
jgi:hypothetical protein